MPQATTTPIEATPASAGATQVVAIERLRESKTNPRRHFSPAGMAELVKSVAEHGVLNALLVRTVTVCSNKPGKATETRQEFQIICGARRYRAAKEAGLAGVPVPGIRNDPQADRDDRHARMEQAMAILADCNDADLARRLVGATLSGEMPVTKDYCNPKWVREEASKP
jgi:ParB/RepB/Spo0J family partition protein